MERFKIKVAVYIILLREGKVLLGRRINTGWQDGNYGLPAGHLEAGESIVEALLRETREEIGIMLAPEDVAFVHTMHRRSDYIDMYFVAKQWSGEPKNTEPEKCDELAWFALDALPSNMIPPVRVALEHYQNGILFSELT
jgi:8-oxo-dGTP diphosphatase